MKVKEVLEVMEGMVAVLHTSAALSEVASQLLHEYGEVIIHSLKLMHQ